MGETDCQLPNADCRFRLYTYELGENEQEHEPMMAAMLKGNQQLAIGNRKSAMPYVS